MSWPADGQPRYVIVETTGFLGHGPGGLLAIDKTLPSRTVAILDRAFCHRTVFKAQSESFNNRGRVFAVARARQLVADRLAELNAEEMAA